MTPNQNAPNLQEISTVAATALPLKDKILIFPIGSQEQHGPHLPMGTDTIILDAIVKGVREKLGSNSPYVFLPSMPYGKSPEHMSFMGTVTFRATTLISILEDIVGSMHTHGVRKMVFLNSHGGNTYLLNSLAHDLKYTYDVEIFCLNLWSKDFMGSGEITRVVQNVAYPEIHAASIETSLLLYLKPELVGDIPQGILPKAPFPSISSGWETKDLSDTGVIGDLKESSQENGEKLYLLLVEMAVSKLQDIVQ